MTQRHYVSNKNESVRMFESDFMEFFTHVHPATPLIIYVPFIGYMLYAAFANSGLSILAVAGLFLVGLLIWTLVEYTIHRWIFHYEPQTPAGKQFHFMAHGVHHDYPNDARRLVLPPIISVPVGIVLAVLSALTFGRFAPPISAGFALGYVCYDSLHYAVHHFPLNRWPGRWLKQYHLRHHYTDESNGYGVSSPLWDYVFRTTRR